MAKKVIVGKLNDKFWSCGSLLVRFAAMARVNQPFFHKNTKNQMRHVNKTHGEFNAALSPWINSAFCRAVTVQRVKLNWLAKTSRESICHVFRRLKTLLTVSQQQKNCLREFRYQMNESSIDLFNWTQRFQCDCKMTIAKMHNLTRAHASKI